MPVLSVADAGRAVRRTSISRADLLRCLDRQGADGLEQKAPYLGYERRPSKEAPAVSATAGPSAPPRGQAERPRFDLAAEGTLPAAFFYCLAECLRIERTRPPGEVPEWYRDAPDLDVGQERPEPGCQPLRAPPLAPWSRLWPFLRAALGAGHGGGQLDLVRAVERTARRACRGGWVGRAQGRGVKAPIFRTGAPRRC